MSNPSVLTAGEISELQTLAAEHAVARELGQYESSDRLRDELIAWGAWPPKDGWHPVFESVAHRVGRLARRGE